MRSERKARNGEESGKGATRTTGLGVGKRSRTDGLHDTAVGRGVGEAQQTREQPADTPAGAKKADKKADKKKTLAKGVDPAANPEVSADAEAEEAEAEAAPAAEGAGEERAGEAEGEGEDREAQASGEGESGVDSLISGVNSVVGSVLGAFGVPYVSHMTFDKAPAAASNRTKVGVGEMVTFKSNMPGKWKADKAAPASTKTSTGDQFIWMATHTKGTAKITFDPGKKGVSPVEVSMTVIEPTVDYLNARKVSFPGSGTNTIAGVNMDSDVTYLPMDVSFRNTTWWEKPGPATGATGYFAEHLRKGRSLPFHNPNPDPLQIDEKNSGITDTAGFWDFIGPFSPGFFEWVIPTFYAVDDGPKHLIKNVHQTCNIDAAGTMTVTKESATKSNAFGA